MTGTFQRKETQELPTHHGSKREEIARGGWVGFKKLMFAYKVGGWIKKRTKTCFRNMYMNGPIVLVALICLTNNLAKVPWLFLRVLTL